MTSSTRSVSTSLALKARWVSLIWSIGISSFVAVTVRAVPALIIPVVATALPFVAPQSGKSPRWLSVLASVILLGFMFETVISVGWLYLPSLFAAVLAAAPAANR